MSVEEELEKYARLALAWSNEEKLAVDDEAKQRTRDHRSVLFMNAELRIAQNPRALKAKAMMLWKRTGFKILLAPEPV